MSADTPSTTRAVNPDYFKGLRHLVRAVGTDRQIAGGVIYGESEFQKRSDISVYPLTRWEELFSLQDTE
jgi:hypothetical protein